MKQEVTGFRLVETPRRAPARLPRWPPTAAGEPPEATEPPSQLSLCTLLFDQLGPAGRELARRAALEFLDLPAPRASTSPCSPSGNRLQLLQQFTLTGTPSRSAVAERDQLRGSGHERRLGARGTACPKRNWTS